MKNVRETSKESYIEILATISERHESCMRGLEALGEATANELAMYLANQGVTPFFNRNFVHPRLTELVGKELVVESGKRKDSISGRKCIVYKVA